MVIDELTYELNAEWAKGSLNAIENGFQKVSSSLLKAVAVTTVAVGGILTGITAINDKTAELANSAETVGLAFNTAFSLGSAVKDIGLNFQNVIDLSEEMNNKIGESKSKYEEWLKSGKGKGKELKLVGGVEDAFKGLDFSIVDKKFKGLNLEQKFKKFSSMDSEKQFKLVLDTASLMDDTQKAVSMVDILMGGEANKIVGYLRKQKTTLSKLIEEKQKLNFLDKEGVEGAKDFTSSFNAISSVFPTISKQISGLIGESLAPLLKKLTDWFKVNKELIQVDLKSWVNTISKTILFLVDLVVRIIDHLGGLKNIIIGLATVWAVLNAPILLTAGAILLALLAFDDFMNFFEGKESIVGDFVESVKNSFEELKETFPTLTAVVSATFQTVSDLFQALSDTISNVWGFITSDKSFSEFITSQFSITGDALKSFVNLFLNIGKQINKIINDILNYFTNFFKNLNIAEKVGEQIDKAKEILADFTPNFNFFGDDEEKKVTLKKETKNTSFLDDALKSVGSLFSTENKEKAVAKAVQPLAVSHHSQTVNNATTATTATTQTTHNRYNINANINANSKSMGDVFSELGKSRGY